MYNLYKNVNHVKQYVLFMGTFTSSKRKEIWYGKVKVCLR